MSENEKLRRLLYRWATWCQRAMADDDNDYLNGRGWDDAEDLTSGTFAALSTPPSKADADDVERVAKAICQSEYRRLDLVSPWWGDGDRPADSIRVSPFEKANYRSIAEAALSAIQNRDAGLSSPAQPKNQ